MNTAQLTRERLAVARRLAEDRARRRLLALAASSALSLVAGAALGYTLGLRARLHLLTALPDEDRHGL